MNYEICISRSQALPPPKYMRMIFDRTRIEKNSGGEGESLVHFITRMTSQGEKT